MHEFSTANQIVRSVLETAKKNKAQKVLSFELEIGAFTFLGKEQLSFWIGELLKNTIAAGVKLKIQTIKPAVECTDCGYKGDIKLDYDPVYHFTLPSLKCPQCDSINIKLKKGRECLLRNIQISK